MSGFVVIRREALDHPVIGGAERFRAWCWLIATACWKPTRFDIQGKTVTIERGQLCASRHQLADAWGWSPSAVERFLTRLETEQMIGRATGQGRTVITICNYAKYQDVPSETGQATGQEAGQPSDKQRTTKEQGNHSDVLEPDGSNTSQRGKRAFARRIDPDWMPSPLPEKVAALVAQWPPGREQRELDGFRDYWTARVRDSARSDWDKTWHNRIRDIHDRILRDSRNDRQRTPAPTGGIAAALDRRIEFGEPARPPGRYDAGGGGDYRALPAPAVARLR